MTQRVHRRRENDPVPCPKCSQPNECLTPDERCGKCAKCGWENRKLSRHGLAPNENSTGDHAKTQVKRKEKRARRKADRLLLDVSQCPNPPVELDGLLDAVLVAVDQRKEQDVDQWAQNLAAQLVLSH